MFIDGAIYVSNEQDNEEDMIDDIVHEIAHATEELFTRDLYKDEKIFNLNRPSHGLYVAPMMWRELKNFSGGGICLVLASLPYNENDYYRNYKEFVKVKWQK